MLMLSTNGTISEEAEEEPGEGEQDHPFLSCLYRLTKTTFYRYDPSHIRLIILIYFFSCFFRESNKISSCECTKFAALTTLVYIPNFSSSE
jgi:hypothetical protein